MGPGVEGTPPAPDGTGVQVHIIESALHVQVLPAASQVVTSTVGLHAVPDVTVAAQVPGPAPVVPLGPGGVLPVGPADVVGELGVPLGPGSVESGPGAVVLGPGPVSWGPGADTLPLGPPVGALVSAGSPSPVLASEPQPSAASNGKQDSRTFQSKERTREKVSMATY